MLSALRPHVHIDNELLSAGSFDCFFLISLLLSASFTNVIAKWKQLSLLYDDCKH